jgi:tripartite-type tricarboxylate transporter receptor subunit TctC
MIRRITAFLSMLALTLTFATAAQAQSYPNKPVKLIVPYPSGQATDIAARIIAEGLSREWGQQVVVENIGGGAAIPGMVTARGAQPDGYTLLMGTSAAMVVNPAIIQKLPYDPFNDFILIGPVFRNPLIIVANDQSPYRSLKDIVDAAKKEPGKLNWGYPGAGTTQHLTGELFKQVAGVNIQGVMYKGSSQMVTDLLGNQIQLSVDGVPANLPHIKAGKLRAIGVSTKQRSAVLPDMPTLAESGLPNYSFDAWIALVGPAGLPKPLVDKLHADTKTVLATKAVEETLAAQGIAVIGSDPETARKFFQTELDKHTQLVKRSGAKLD